MTLLQRGEKMNERRADYCDRHKDETDLIAQNTIQLAKISTGIFIGRLVAGGALIISMAIIGSTMTDIKSTLTEIRYDVKLLAPVNSRLERLEKDIDAYDARLRRLEQRVTQ
jgi:hypothetical protein